MTRWAAAAALAVAALAAGCSADDDDDGAPPLRFEPISLPAPAGATARVAALAYDGQRWWAAGSTIDAAGARHPALWRSGDAASWDEVRTAPVSFYGERAELYSVASGPKGVVAVGAASGGAHGNPRTASWVLDGEELREVAAPFELYGGPRAMSVRAVAAGADGFTIVGTRRAANERAGAVAWVSTDGQAFTLVDDDPTLQSGPDELARPLAVTATAAGFVAVGEVRYRGRGTLDADGIIWTSSDGRRWTRAAVGPGGLGADGSVTVAAVAASRSGGAVAAGVATRDEDASIEVWSSGDGVDWPASPALTFAADDDAAVTGVAVDGDVLLAAGRVAERPGVVVFTGDGTWMPLPDGAPVGEHVDVDIAAAGGALVVAAADDRRAGLWRASMPVAAAARAGS